MRILFSNPLMSTPKKIQNILSSDPDLEAGFSMEELIFGEYKLEIWKKKKVEKERTFL